MVRGVEPAAPLPTIEGLLALSPDGILILDPAGRVAAANENAARLLGRPRRELVGLDLRDLLADPNASEAALAATLPGAPRRLDARGPRGESVPIEVTHAPAGSSTVLALREPAPPATRDAAEAR